MIASHELNFGSRIIFKRLYVVLCNFYEVTFYGIFLFLFPYRCCDCDGCCHCLIVRSRLSSILYRSLCLAAVAVFVSTSFRCRRLWCKNYFAFSLNKREASPESRNRWIHASLSPWLVLLLSIAIIAPIKLVKVPTWVGYGRGTFNNMEIISTTIRFQT